jgi:hypothetical protein
MVIRRFSRCTGAFNKKREEASSRSAAVADENTR